MRLTQKYYILNYRNYKNLSEFFDYIKSLEEQIDVTNIEMTLKKQTLLYSTMAFCNESQYQLLVQS